MEQLKHIMRILSLSLCCWWTTLRDSLPANRSFSNALLSTSQHLPFCPTNQLVLDSHLVSSHMFYYMAPTTAATKCGQIAYPSCQISTSVLFLLLCAHWSGSTMCIVDCVCHRALRAAGDRFVLTNECVFDYSQARQCPCAASGGLLAN